MKRTQLKRGKPLRRKSKSKSAQWREMLLEIYFECVKRMYAWEIVGTKRVKGKDVLWFAGRCWWCGCDTLKPGGAVHHIFHQQNHPAGRYLFANGRPICNPCHAKIHLFGGEPAFIAAVVDEIGGEEFVELQKRCQQSRGSYNVAMFERDLKDLNDKLVTLGGCTE